MRRAIVIILLASVLLPRPGRADQAVHLVLWHQQGQAAMQQLGIQKLFDDWAAVHSPGATLTLVQVDHDDMLTDYRQAASVDLPHLLWLDNTQLASFAGAGTLRPLDDLKMGGLFLPSVEAGAHQGGKTYGLPIQVGNALLMLYNKRMVPTPPQTFAELIQLGQRLAADPVLSTIDGFFPLVTHERLGFWIFPIAHGYGGTEFAADGHTPALDSDAWAKTYRLMYDIKFKYKLIANDCDYECLDLTFRASATAIAFNGDWALYAQPNGYEGYAKNFGADLGVAPWPALGDKPGQMVPAPFIVGQYLTITQPTNGGELAVAEQFLRYLATDPKAALSWTIPNGRLPALSVALDSEQISLDPVLSQVRAVVRIGLLMPSQPDFSCIISAVDLENRLVINDAAKPEDAPKDAQKSAQDCIDALPKR